LERSVYGLTAGVVKPALHRPPRLQSPNTQGHFAHKWTRCGRRVFDRVSYLPSEKIEPTRPELKSLSDRELQVFSLIGRGFGVSRLARELHLSVKTIETYQTHIKEKLGLHSAAELSDKAGRRMLHSIRRNLRLKKLLKPAARV
jgi:DNA-binding CsgD family transcriptional regulator